MLEIINTFWHGSPLTKMERMSLCSFLHHGHPVHLYLYAEQLNVPEGVVVKDANEILEKSIFESYVVKTNGSNLFRVKLLRKIGGIWSDLDNVCMRPIDLSTDYIFPKMDTVKYKISVNPNVLKTPVDAPILTILEKRMNRLDPKTPSFGANGFRFFHEAVTLFRLQKYCCQKEFFCPIDPAQWKLAIKQEAVNIPESCYTVHLWASRWKGGIDKNSVFGPECLYGRLLAQYLPNG